MSESDSPGPASAGPSSSDPSGKSPQIDVIVVGAGPGGLASAILLAGTGLRVAVVERKDVPGGRMGRLEEDGFAWDTGPTILQLPQVLQQIFERAGLRFRDYVTLDPVEPNTRVHFWDGTHLDTWHDQEKNRAEWARLVPGGAARFDRFFREHTDKYRIAYDRFIGHDADSALSYFNPLRLFPAAKFKPWESLYTSLMKTLGDERLVYAMSYPSKYLGLHPTTCSSVFSVVPFLELAFGVFHPRGGFRALADAMARATTDLGGSIRYGSGVKRILVERGQACGVELESGERIRSRYVVVNADWADASRRLLSAEDRSPPDVETRRYSCSTFMLYLGLDRRYDHVPHHSICLTNGARRTDRAALTDAALDEVDAPFYVCNPSVTDPSGAPPGCSTLYVLVPSPNTSQAVDWAARATPFAERIVDRLGLVGLDGIKDHIRVQKVFTAETWRDDFRVFRGAVFNLSHGWTQLGPFRPKSRDRDVDGLYWVGGGTHPGSGLLTIFESANLAAAAIAKERGRHLVPSRAPTLAASA